MKHRILSWAFRIFAILLGVFFMVFGEFDDSPGLQGIGLILILIVVFAAIRSRKTR